MIVTLVASDTTFTPSILKRNFKDHNRRMIKKRADPALPASLGTLFEITYNYRSTFKSNDEQVGCEFPSLLSVLRRDASQGSDPGFVLPSQDYSIPLSTSRTKFALADGSTVPDGNYKVLLRALKLFGDETVSEDYGSFPSSSSPAFFFILLLYSPPPLFSCSPSPLSFGRYFPRILALSRHYG